MRASGAETFSSQFPVSCRSSPVRPPPLRRSEGTQTSCWQTSCTTSPAVRCFVHGRRPGVLNPGTYCSKSVQLGALLRHQETCMAIALAPTDTLDQKRLLKVLTDYRRGDFAARMPGDRTGLAGKICDALNEAIERNEKLVKELERLSTVVGKAGNIKQRAMLPNAEGQW